MRNLLISLAVLATALTFASLTGAPAMAQTIAQQTQTEAANLTIVREKFDAWAAGTGGPYDLLADDVSWTITGTSDAAKTYPSREAFMSEVIRPFNARMSQGLKPVIRQIHADGDAVIILFDAAGVARDGKPYANTYAWFFDMKDGRIARAVAFFDATTFNDLWRRLTP